MMAVHLAWATLAQDFLGYENAGYAQAKGKTKSSISPWFLLHLMPLGFCCSPGLVSMDSDVLPVD